MVIYGCVLCVSLADGQAFGDILRGKLQRFLPLLTADLSNLTEACQEDMESYRNGWMEMQEWALQSMCRKPY